MNLYQGYLERSGHCGRRDNVDNDKVSEILRNHKSYRYAAQIGEDFLDGAPTLYNERRKSLDRWDGTRYNRIVNIVKEAVDEVLTDEERTVIKRKYLDQNPITLRQISELLNYERKTIERRHKSALKKLGQALDPLEGHTEITPFEHHFKHDEQSDIVN